MKPWMLALLFLVLAMIACALCSQGFPGSTSQPVQIQGGSHVYPVQVVPAPLNRPGTTTAPDEEPSTAPKTVPAEPQSESPDTEHSVEPVEPVEPIHVGGIR
jgi:hypothetical protein